MSVRQPAKDYAVIVYRPSGIVKTINQSFTVLPAHSPQKAEEVADTGQKINENLLQEPYSVCYNAPVKRTFADLFGG